MMYQMQYVEIHLLLYNLYLGENHICQPKLVMFNSLSRHFLD